MATTDTRPNQRDHILDVALRLMSAHGAAGMSMRQLATACGVQVAAIYHYFDSKDALLAAVVEERRYGTRLADPLDVDPGAPPEQRLRRPVRLRVGRRPRGGGDLAPHAGRGHPGRAGGAARGPRPAVDGPERRDAGLGGPRSCPRPQPTEAVAGLLVGQLLAGFVRRVFEPDGDTDASAERIRRQGADALVAAVFHQRP